MQRFVGGAGAGALAGHFGGDISTGALAGATAAQSIPWLLSQAAGTAGGRKILKNVLLSKKGVLDNEAVGQIASFVNAQRPAGNLGDF